MRKALIIFVAMIGMSLQSCYTTKYVDHYVSVIDDLNNQYLGKDKSYIIEHFPYAPSDNKRLDDQYEILIFERYRNPVVGYGITKFHMKNNRCYQIETNEYKNAPRLEKVSIF